MPSLARASRDQDGRRCSYTEVGQVDKRVEDAGGVEVEVEEKKGGGRWYLKNLESRQKQWEATVAPSFLTSTWELAA